MLMINILIGIGAIIAGFGIAIACIAVGLVAIGPSLELSEYNSKPLFWFLLPTTIVLGPSFFLLPGIWWCRVIWWDTAFWIIVIPLIIGFHFRNC